MEVFEESEETIGSPHARGKKKMISSEDFPLNRLTIIDVHEILNFQW